MRHLIIFIFSAFLTFTSYGQSFTAAFKEYWLGHADTLSNHKVRKKIKRFVKAQIAELDTVFQSYKARTNFDFNTADTLFLIFDSPAESPFTSDIIIWSGKDTISYSQGFEVIKPFKNKRIITYGSFFPKVQHPPGSRIVTERDSLVTLVSKRDFATISRLGDNQTISDGSYIKIYVAFKEDGQYKFESCFPRQFVIRDVYRKE